MLLPLVVALMPTALAEPASPLPLRQDAPAAEAPADAVPGERTTLYEVGFRGRMMSVPDAILDVWYFNDDADGYHLVTGGESRPSIRAASMGLEFALVGESGANGIFYVDYARSTMDEGYWDDKEEPANHLDGNYLVPSRNLGLVALGADYLHEVHFVRLDQTDNAFGLSALFGGGLGVTTIVGEIQEWEPQGTQPAFVRYQAGADPDKTTDIPRVLPMVDIQAALRFNFGDRVVVRVEGGLHDMLFYGATLGLRF